MKNVAIIIPARHASSRLPAKALAKIADKPLVWHVWQRALEANLGEVFVATDHKDIKTIATGFGANTIMTPPSCPTGSDRVATAYTTLSKKYDAVINLQGDIPFIDAKEIAKTLIPLTQGYDVGTLVTNMTIAQQKNPSCVKAVVSTSSGQSVYRCHWFCRASMPYGHHHLGVYAYRPAVLEAFSTTSQHPLERQESLEQLRLLTLGFSIGASQVSSLALEVNTKEDLGVAREHADTVSV